MSQSQRTLTLLTELADGRFHSGEALGEKIGISRAAVWKYIKQLREQGLSVTTVAGRGYQVRGGIELLDRQTILDAWPSNTPHTLSGLDILSSVDSTNRCLLSRAKQNCSNGFAVLAEHQTAGRGRQGRSWVSPFARNVYLSLYWQFETGPAALAGLSLAMGMAVVDALREQSLPSAKLKWPNDVWLDNKKLGGILIEMFGDAAGPCHVVIGVGLNVDMRGCEDLNIDQSWADIASHSKTKPSRNTIASTVLQHLLKNISMFAAHGFAPFLEKWASYDALNQSEIQVHTAQQTLTGRALGVNSRGELQVETQSGEISFDSAQVSVRRQNT